MDDGWGFLFAWHSDCWRACRALMRSLEAVINGGGNIGDHLFRLVISNCENMAIRPQWWESLTEQQRNEIAATATCQTDVFSRTRADYLARGLENVCEWQFQRVVSDME